MLLENIPEPYKEVMSEYTDALLQEDKLQMNTFLADGKYELIPITMCTCYFNACAMIRAMY